VSLLQRIIAKQLANPSGLIGRAFTARWLNKANAKMNDLTLEQLALAPGDRVLEIGFGGGDLLQKILNLKQAELVAGVEQSGEMLRSAGKRFLSAIRNSELELHSGDIENLPFPGEAFTKLCSVNTIYFWRNPEKALTECRRVLKRPGRLVLCFNSRKDMEAWPIHRHGFRLYELGEVEQLLEKSGFSQVQVTSANDTKQGLFHCVNAGSQ
jgi:arsenite methyltransferase